MLLRFSSRRLPELYVWNEDISTVEWCERNIYLHSDASPITGGLSFDETPHVPFILDQFDRPEVYKIVLNWSTQTAKTFSMQCAWAKAMDTDPCRMQWSIKNNNDLEDYLEEKMTPFIRGIKVLQEKLLVLAEDKKKKTRAKSMNVYGGGTTFTGTTAAERRSKSVKYIFMDEIALYGKGHVIELEGRTKFFERFFPKMFEVSSRKHPGDEMDESFDTCETQYELQTFCSECEQTFYAGSDHFKTLPVHKYLADRDLKREELDFQDYVSEMVKDVYLECPHCQHRITNAEKDKNILEKKYSWVLVKGKENGRSIGAKANALATRITSFEKIAILQANAEYKADVEVLHQFYIDYFNEFYEKKVDAVDSGDLLLLGNGLSKWVAPGDTVKIYMGVDTQKDHFWWSVRAYCYDKVSHTLAHGRAETFDDLEKIFEIGQSIVTEYGEVLAIDKLGIDRRGYNTDKVKRTDEVDEWVKSMILKWRRGDENRIYATEGEPKLSGDTPYSIVTRKDESDRRIKVDVKVMKLSNIYLKTSIRTAMSNTIESKKSEEPEAFEGVPKFLINQTTIDADMQGTTSISYTRQITAESYDYDIDKNGRAAKEKTFINPKQADNHCFDTDVICEGFAQKDQIYLEKRQNTVGLDKILHNLAEIVL